MVYGSKCDFISHSFSRSQNIGTIIEKYLKNNTEVTYKYVGSDKVTFNTKKGSKLGVVKIYDGDVLLATSNVYLENNIEYYPIITYIMIGIAVIFVLLIVKKINKKKHRRRRR